MTVSAPLVRIASDDDVPALCRLRRTWNEEREGMPIEDAAFERRFEEWYANERSTRTFFILELERSPVGMANIKRYDRMPVAGRTISGCWGYLGNVFVLAAHRNTGVGRVLIEHLISWAAEVGMEHLRLAPSELSKSFYTRLGFLPGSVFELDPPPR